MRFKMMLLLLIFGTTAQATVIHVPSDYTSIQAGIEAAAAYDTVLVAPGIYYENLDFGGKNLVLTSEAGPLVTELRPASLDDRIIWLHGGETRASVIEGFTISYSPALENGVYIQNASPVIRGNHFTNHLGAYDNYNALHLQSGSGAYVEGNLFYDNPDIRIVARLFGTDTGQFINNTIVGGNTGLYVNSSDCSVRNNVITNCTQTGCQGYFTISVDYNNSYGNGNNYAGTFSDPTNISVDPEFFDTSRNLYSLNETSGCIDAGNPDAQYNDPDGTRDDMGASFFDQTSPNVSNLNLGSASVGRVLNHTPSFFWSLYSTSGPQSFYEIQVGTDNDWTTAEMWASGHVPSFDTTAAYGCSALVDGVTYYYRLRARNGTTWSDWSESVFRMNEPPTAPNPAFPISQGDVSIYNVHLVVDNSFHSIGDYLTYDFEVYSDAGLSTLVDTAYGVSQQADQTRSGVFDGLLNNTEYWWRCRSHDGYEFSDWSIAESFITRGPVVIHVPADQPTIQAGIDSAQEFDTVLVADGTYSGDGNRDLDFGDINLVLKSVNGPDVTIIDCGGSGSEPHIGISITADQDSTSVIDGFTVMNAYDTSGYNKAAIYCTPASPTIRNCYIRDNTCNGIYGGKYISRMMIENCRITNNTRYGLSTEYGTSPCIYNSEISFNGWDGANIYTTAATTTEVRNSLFRGNGNSGVTIVQSLAWRNIVVRNNTFVGNSSGLMGWEDFPLSEKDPPVANLQSDTASNVSYNIFAFNTDAGLELFTSLEYNNITVHCNNAYGNTNYDYHPDETLYHGDTSGNISLDPLFCDTAAGNFRLDQTSPCAPPNNSCGTLMGAFAVGCSCCENRGNVNGMIGPSGPVDVGDLAYLVDFLFKGGAPPPCEEEGNVDNLIGGGGPIDVADLTYLVDYLFKGGPPPPACV